MSAPEVTPRRWSTTDLVGPTLLFVGGFLLAAAIALPTLLVDGLRTVPLSTDFTSVATAADATVLDRCSLHTATATALHADLVRQQRVVAVQPSDERRVTLQAGTSIQAENLLVDGKKVDPTTPRPGAGVPDDGSTPCTDPTIVAIKDRVTLNRTSALPDLAGGGSSEIQYDSRSAPVPAPDRRGFTYVLPFDVDPGQRHSFFDPTTRRTVDLRTDGDTEVAGRDVTRFTAVIPDTDLHALAGGTGTGPADRPTAITRPASWFGVGGDPARALTATLHHRSTWTLAVDTRTGMIVDTHLDVDESYRFPAGTPNVPADYALTALHADFRYDERTRAEMTERSDDLARPLLIWGRWVPIGAGVLGVLLVGGGLVLLNPARIPARLRPRTST